MENLKINYTPHNILITGGAGFIGSYVLEYMLIKYKYNIVNVDILDNPSLLCVHDNLIKKYSNYFFYENDIRNEESMNIIVKNHKIDTIMHFAACTHVDLSFNNPEIFVDVNIRGTQILLNVAKCNNIKRFIYVSTDEVYGDNLSKIPKIENDILNPTNPYSASKAGGELMALSYFKSFSVPLIITRGNNVYGPRQFPEKLIPKMICRLLSGMKCCIHGNGGQKRSFLFGVDVARAFDIILHCGNVGEIYNIGNKEEKSVIEIVYDILGLMDINKENYDNYIEYVDDRLYNDSSYHINSSKLENLGWNPEITWERGLKMTVDWYIKNKKLWDYSHEGWDKSVVNLALQPHPNQHKTHDMKKLNKNMQ